MSHKCHWPGCEVEVPPAMWGCKDHWFRLPKRIRIAIWKAYRPGQEIDKNPSKEYIAAAKAAQDWIKSDREPFYIVPVDNKIVSHHDRYKVRVMHRAGRFGDRPVTTPLHHHQAELICNFLIRNKDAFQGPEAGLEKKSFSGVAKPQNRG